MKLFRKRFRFLNKKGFSMVELICGVAILGVISTAVTGALVISGDSYKRGTNETEIQQEAQLVANQISDLMIDASADVTFASDTLTIKQGTKTYTVTWDSVTKQLKYQESDSAGAGYTSDVQLMAENVDSFNVNVDDFTKTGYAKMDLTIAREGRDYPSTFTISARNKDITSEVTAVAKIITKTDLLLEPNMTFNFAPETSVTGIANTDVEWEFYEGFTPMDPNTTISSAGVLVVGNNETANLLRLKVSTDEKDASGNPLADKMVVVRVRRANNIAVTGQLISGNPEMAGAKYELTAAVVGKNFERHEMDTDDEWENKNGYAVDWTSNLPVGSPHDLDPVAYDPANPTIRKAVLTLGADLTVGESIVVTAVSAHANGVNKKGIAYASITDDWTLQPTEPIVDPISDPDPSGPAGTEGWMRRSDNAQGTIDDLTALKQSVGGVEHKIQIQYRALPDGTWSGWLENRPEYQADANNSQTINLRPLFTAAMEYDKAYQIRIRVVIVDGADNIVWPDFATTPAHIYMLESTMPAVTVPFNSAILGMTTSYGNTKNGAPNIVVTPNDREKTILTIDGDNVLGIPVERIQNEIRFTVEKEISPDNWDEVSNNEYGVQEVKATQGNLQMIFDMNATTLYPGTYRVKVWADDLDESSLAADGSIVAKDPKQDYILYDVDANKGVYYFTVTNN